MNAELTMNEVPTIQVLLVEDDAGVARIVSDGLSERGFRVRQAETLAASRAALTAEGFDVMVLDLALPDGNGLDLAASLRASGNELPILMLTAQNGVQDRVTGFREGADDYLCKPFDVDELAARLHAIVRRTAAGNRHVLQYSDVELDLLTRTVTRGSTRAVLSARELDLLSFLLRHPEQTLPRERILAEVWGDEAEDDSNVLNVYINYLRNKLEPPELPRLIHTVRGKGYCLAEREPYEA